MKKLSQSELIDVLNKAEFNVVDGELFSHQHVGSIWFHHPDHPDARSKQFEELSWDGDNTNKFPVTELLKQYGWYAESYDSETLFAYLI